MATLKPQLLLAGCLLLFATPVIAGENPKAVADELFAGTTLSFNYKGNYSNATISVSGPNGFIQTHYQKNGSLTLDLNDLGSLSDGLYKYEITVATDKTVNTNSNMDNGRGKNAKTTMNVGEKQSGQFRVEGGVIVGNTNISETREVL